MNICEKCKIKKLEKLDVKMTIGIGYNMIGKCDICKKNNNYLFSYYEEKLK